VIQRSWRKTGALLLSTLLLTGGVRAAEDEALAKARSALEAVRRLKDVDLQAKPALKAAIDRLAVQLQGQPELVELTRDFHLTNQFPAVFRFVIDHPTDPATGDGLRLLLAEQPALVTAGLVDTNQAPSLLTGLGNLAQRDTVPLLLPWLTDSPGRSLAARRTALRGLLKTPEGATALVESAAAGSLPADLRPLAATELQAVRWPKIKAEAAKVLPPPPRSDKALPPIGELVRRTGDVGNGARVFRRPEVACITCHQINGEGIDFGPKLSEIGAKLGKDALYDAILEPSSGISFGYEAWMFTLKNGDDAFGLLASETEDELLVKTQGGTLTKYRKADVAKREKQPQSIMPEGLTATLTATELVDLVEYLASLKKATP